MQLYRHAAAVLDSHENANCLNAVYGIRPDTNFDELILGIYGDIEKLEKYEEEEVLKLNKKNMNNAYAESRKRGIMYQAEQRVRTFCSLVFWANSNSMLIPPLTVSCSIATEKKSVHACGGIGGIGATSTEPCHGPEGVSPN